MSSDRDFFKEVKQVKGHSKIEGQVIDGLRDNKEIANKFAMQYKGLYNSNPSQEEDLKRMIENLNTNIRMDTSSVASCIITVDLIKKAIKQLKSNKQDGAYSAMASDHFINAIDKFHEHLSIFFTKCLSHGYMPDAMVLSTLIPIPKDANNMHLSDKYRGIALSAICTKLFEYVILDLYRPMLMSGNLQFAYKTKSSTTQCTWMAREVISYYNNNGSDVYSCVLDCSKAFDRIRHDKLMEKLVSIGLPPIITQILMHMYINSHICVRWKDIVSEPFDATNGVKQGSVLSPILFTLCLDDLISALEKQGDGCWIGNKFYGIDGYADDVKLLWPALSGLQKMLDVCKQFSVETGLTFNATKTVCIKYHCDRHNEPVQYSVYLGNDKLTWHTQVKHLGHQFTCCSSFNPDIAYRKGQFIGCVNNILTQFGFAHPSSKVKLLATHGYNFYGSSLWDLYSSACNQLYTTWNIAIRRLCSLPRTTHTRFLMHIAKLPHLKHSLKCRFIKFVCNILNSSNDKLQFLGKLSTVTTKSITGHNITNIMCEYGLKMSDITNGNALSKMNNTYYQKINVESDIQSSQFICELLDSLYERPDCELNTNELREILDFIATN